MISARIAFLTAAVSLTYQRMIYGTPRGYRAHVRRTRAGVLLANHELGVVGISAETIYTIRTREYTHCG
jgi:hypothetical protein